MSNGLNKTILIGNLGQDPELRYTKGGKAVLRCRLATNESWVKDGERHEHTTWHTVIVWGKRGEALNRYLGKGQRIGVEGRIRNRSWEDDQGQKRYSSEVEAVEVVLLGGARGDADAQRSRMPLDSVLPEPAEAAADDVPF